MNKSAIGSTNALKEIIAASGYKIQFLARQLGLTHQGFMLKVNDVRLFRVREVVMLSELLMLENQVRDAIFFGPFEREV